MGETLSVTRIGRTPTTAVELVYSTDDGGWYLSNQDFQRVKSRTSVKVYPTEAKARADFNAGTVEWEDWS